MSQQSDTFPCFEPDESYSHSPIIFFNIHNIIILHVLTKYIILFFGLFTLTTFSYVYKQWGSSLCIFLAFCFILPHKPVYFLTSLRLRSLPSSPKEYVHVLNPVGCFLEEIIIL